MEALWNHLSRRLGQKQRLLKNGFIDLLRNGAAKSQLSDRSSEMEQIVDKWICNVNGAVNKLVLMCDLLDLHKPIDAASLKQVFMVGPFDFRAFDCA